MKYEKIVKFKEEEFKRLTGVKKETFKEDLSLNDRIYHCDCCGITINRDYNASINIRNQGIKLVIS